MNLQELIGEKYNYKCFDLLKYLLNNNKEFQHIVAEGILNNKISFFPNSLWQKIKEQNFRGLENFELVFINGLNIGDCTGTSIQLSYSIDYPYICGGTLKILEGTNNSPDGRHTWLIDGRNIIDTSLMLIIDREYAINLGYQEEFKRNPNGDPRYESAKDFANDSNLKKR